MKKGVFVRGSDSMSNKEDIYGYRLNSSSLSLSTTSSKALLLALFMVSFLVISSSTAAVNSSVSDGGGSSGGLVQWQILTKRNFSSQIRLHPHLLLMVTVPWSGESRSLTKELSQLVANKQEKFGNLTLMLLYRNTEKMLADAIGATEGVTILCYHHSLPYKYQGRLRAQNILHSAHFLMLRAPEQLPLESLETPEDLKIFLQSTDKALLLVEFCGWASSLLGKGKNNESVNAFGGPFGADFSGETNRSLAAKGKKNQKGLENEKLTCGVQNQFSGIPSAGEFSSVSDCDSIGAKNMTPHDGMSCSFAEFLRFDTFFSNFTPIAREFFLPPERLRFGLVPERSLLSSLGVEDCGSWLSSLNVGQSDSWLMILHFAGCPSCSKVFREGDDLRHALLMQNSLVRELGGAGHDPEPVLPAHEPSILLFVDRSSDLSETRRKSKEAIDAFRNFALHYETSYGKGQQNNNLFGTYQVSKSMPVHQSLKLSPKSENFGLDEMSIMIVNEGNHVTLDKNDPSLEGNSLHDVLAYVLKNKNGVKLSSLAKKVGFELLSEDFDIKVQETKRTKMGVLQSDEVSLNPKKGLHEASVDLPKGQIPDTLSTTTMEREEQFKPDHYLGSAEDEIVDQKALSEITNLREQKLHHKHFIGSFIFSDSGYQLLEALTAGSKIPSVVIVDPILQKHYVLPEETVFTYTSLSHFLDGFLNGSLHPYQRSESVVPSPREGPSPPFVNLDFHEVDSIPRVTTSTFSELVNGFNKSDISNVGHVSKKDVLVLFSNSWCGFCQRMELIVREVYRAFKHHASLLNNGPTNKGSVLADDLKESDLPLIYFMDCTVNECSSILRSSTQRELYPSLLLFPAESKNAVPYEGDTAVSDIIKFIIDQGNNPSTIVKEKGITQDYQDASQIAVHKEASLSKGKYHEVLLKYRTPENVIRYKHIRASRQVNVGSILIATDKLFNVHPFEESTILIIKADPGSGFQGLIVNKHISWDSLHELEEGLELLKEARLSVGGPLLKHGMPLVALTRRTSKGENPEILPSVYFLDQLATIDQIEGLKLHNYSIMDYWFFLGYSSWGWDQLFDEIAQGAWNISSNHVQVLDWPWR
ncbi:uncharacterized protein LOC131300750 isoform X1 [Rhododendron vialii]|uniref:uncharacterized protein LOC131300750 isoform X1 n=1 Tax=Rhododendron vialii TaxID=182163 RepID=UPI00266005CA|nr:uncharacterized protein LOC131300750 isoform X1 [Rhododendron vialii]